LLPCSNGVATAHVLASPLLLRAAGRRSAPSVETAARRYAVAPPPRSMCAANQCHSVCRPTPFIPKPLAASGRPQCLLAGEVCVLTKSLTTDVSGVLPRLSGMRCTGTFERDRNWLVSLRRCSPGRFPGGGELESGRPSCSTTTPSRPRSRSARLRVPVPCTHHNRGHPRPAGTDRRDQHRRSEDQLGKRMPRWGRLSTCWADVTNRSTPGNRST
jgi:hypothetical protein